MSATSDPSLHNTVAAIRQVVVSDLEHRAKSAKDADDGLAWLQHAKLIEDAAAASTAPSSSGGNPFALQLKKLAVYCKRRGDVSAAMEFLSRAKQLEELSMRQREEEEEGECDEEENRAPATTPTKEEFSQNKTEEFIAEEERGTGIDDNVEGSAGLMTDQEDALGEGEDMAFTDDDMMDEEIMMEAFLMGMEVPSQVEYSERILRYKRHALELKRGGDVPGAAAQLRIAKQLLTVQTKLEQSKEGLGLRANHDEEEWIERLGSHESKLLGETFRQNSDINLQDLEGMGDEDVREIVAMGMTLPSPEDFRRTGVEKSKEALAYKQAGNIDMAKVMLLQSKKYKLQAERLEKIARSDGEEDQELSEENFMDSVSREDKSNGHGDKEQRQQSETVSRQEQPSRPKEDPWFHKPSAEIKVELLRVKNEGNLAEAKKLLETYKRVLEKESQAKEVARRRQLLEQMRKQLDIADTQMRLFAFYQRFVNDPVGTEQLSRWIDYTDMCRKATREIEKDGSGAMSSVSVDRETKLLLLKEDDVIGIVESGTASLNGALEVSVLEVLGLHENKAMQRFITKQREQLRGQCPVIEVTVKLPQQSNLIFRPSAFRECERRQSSFSDRSQDKPKKKESGRDTTPFFRYAFEESQTVLFPRGDSRAAKAVPGKLEIKKVQISVVAKVPPPPAEEDGGRWSFFSSSPARTPAENATSAAGDSNPAATLGKVTLELKGLLTRNCIAGDFPLVLNSEEYGGRVRFCLRTDAPFDQSQFRSPPYDATLARHSSALRALLVV